MSRARRRGWAWIVIVCGEGLRARGKSATYASGVPRLSIRLLASGINSMFFTSSRRDIAKSFHEAPARLAVHPVGDERIAGGFQRFNIASNRPGLGTGGTGVRLHIIDFIGGEKSGLLNSRIERPDPEMSGDLFHKWIALRRSRGVRIPNFSNFVLFASFVVNSLSQ